MSELARFGVDDRDGIAIASVRGELDASNASGIGEDVAAAIPADARAVIVDLSEVAFLDSSGIGALFGLARRLGARRQRLRVVMPPSSPVSRALEIVRFGRAAPVDATLDEAVAASREWLESLPR